MTKPQLYFEDPRLRMTLAGRIFVRTTGVLSYILILIAALLALLSTLIWLRWLGIFALLVLADRFTHRQEGDVPIPELLGREKINLAQALAPEIAPLLARAHESAIFLKVDTGLMFGKMLLQEKEIRAGLARLDVKPEEMAAKLDDFLGREESQSQAPREERLALLRNVLEVAFYNAQANGRNFIGRTDIFSALGTDGPEPMRRLFTVFDIDPGDLERAFIFVDAKAGRGIFRRLPGEISGIVLPAHRRTRHRVMNRAWTARPTPTLDIFGRDFTDAARGAEIGFLIGHEAEYEHMTTILSRGENPNALLVGDAGAGKETLIAHLAFKISKDEVPPALFDKRLVSLDISRLVSGGTPEELQKRLNRIVDEIQVAGNVILYIPDIHNLLKTSGAAYVSAADALLPVLRDNTFPIVGTTYPREYREQIEPQTGFAGIFEVVEVKEISAEDAEKVLVYEALILESKTRMTVSFGAIKKAVELAKKYFKNILLPASAAELLKSAVTSARELGDDMVTHEDVIRAAEARINVPLEETGKEESEKLLHLEETIRARLVGQEEAVKAVADSLRQYRSGLARKNGPIASFLFVGPTGVGKTELAKILAEIQFKSVSAMMRFDMTEFKDTGSIARFIGSPDGQVPGALTEAVKKRPYGLILLDEFEKAAPDILDLFLQVLDDGRLTDVSGRTVDFENTIIIATSNAHSDLINEALRKGESMAAIADYLKTRLVDVLKPELLNRFSKIVIFHDLSPADVQKIAVLELKKVVATLTDKGLTLNYGEEVVAQIAKWGYDPAFGARPLRRAIEEHLKAPLATWLLENNPPRGAEIKVNLEGDHLLFASK